MAKTTKPRYSKFADLIDVDAFEEAINFQPIEHRNGEDIGYCLDLWGMHQHGDTTGKFSINREKRVYHCFVCGGGNFLSLAMEVNEMTEDDATEWLQQFTRGDVRSATEFVDDFKDLLDKHESKKPETMPYFNEHVLSRFNEETDFFASRGISDEVVTSHRLGYSALAKRLAPMRGGERIDEDYYGPTAVFPHYWMGRLVGWQHRWLDHPDTPKWLAKYTNTTDFPGSTTLYNYDWIFQVRPDKWHLPLVVVESVPTVLFLESLGIAAVACFGGKIAEAQLKLLRRFQRGVILAPDNDKVGREFAETASTYLQRDIPVKVAPVVKGNGADLGDYAQSEDPLGAVLYDLAQAKSPDILGL